VHSLSAYVTKTEFFNGHEKVFINHALAKQDCVIFLADSLIDVKQRIGTFAKVDTDYFGGFGEQKARFYHRGDNVFQSDDDGSINEALKRLGVSRSETEDEFDAIGLGSYRSEQDLINKELSVPNLVLRTTLLSLMTKLQKNLQEQLELKEQLTKLAEEHPDYNPEDDQELTELGEKLQTLFDKIHKDE
jgi:hypothetical protein